MNKKKKNKCIDLRNELENQRLNLQDSLRLMNQENDRAVRLRNEIDNLESQSMDIARSASLNAIGVGDKKGRRFSIGGLAMDGIDGAKLLGKIKDKMSELHYINQNQVQFQKKSEKYEKIISNLQNRIDQMGCN